MPATVRTSPRASPQHSPRNPPTSHNSPSTQSPHAQRILARRGRGSPGRSPGFFASSSPASSPDRFVPAREDPAVEELRSFALASALQNENLNTILLEEGAEQQQQQQQQHQSSRALGPSGTGAATVGDGFAAVSGSPGASPRAGNLLSTLSSPVLLHQGGAGGGTSPTKQDTTPARELYKEVLAGRMFPGQSAQNVSLSGQRPAMSSSPGSAQCPAGMFSTGQSAHRSPLRELHTAVAKLSAKRVRIPRRIAQQADRLLDAPAIQDDYYLNLLDWHAVDNCVAVALQEAVYIWNADTSSSYELCSLAEQTVSALSFCKVGPLLALGTTKNQILIYDYKKRKLLARFDEHRYRVGALDWYGYILASGSRDLTVKIWHVTNGQTEATATLTGHEGEVCGIRWSPDGTMLATGGNDNLLNIWPTSGMSNATRPLHSFSQHCAAVKAIAWCPWQPGLLASGGGTQDRTIRFWNTTTGACINHVDTKSQVCSIQWSRHSRELISSHGYSQNQLVVWQYPSMTKLAELKGHTRRVLYMAMSPDGTTVASAAADETVRLWKVFEPAAQTRARGTNSPLTIGSVR